jgi:hypothetical protein
VNGTGSKTGPKRFGDGGGRRHVNGPQHSRAALSLKDAPQEWRALLLEINVSVQWFLCLG